MLLATSGHIPLGPAKVVKANTLQKKDPYPAPTPRTENEKVPLHRGTR